jgi:hypothetical protein
MQMRYHDTKLVIVIDQSLFSPNFAFTQLAFIKEKKGAVWDSPEAIPSCGIVSVLHIWFFFV